MARRRDWALPLTRTSPIGPARRHVAAARRAAQRPDRAVPRRARHHCRRLLAIARAGTALGAHRHHRDWARISSRVLVVFAPVALHAAFDFPLLTLQQNPDINTSTRMVLGATSVLIGFSSMAFAVRLVRRVSRHHAPRTETARERLSQLRRMWALLVAGGGAGFAGLAFVLTSVHQYWLANPERHTSLVLDSGRSGLDPDRNNSPDHHHGDLFSRPQPDAQERRSGFLGPRSRLNQATSRSHRAANKFDRTAPIARAIMWPLRQHLPATGEIPMTFPQDITNLQSKMSAAVRAGSGGNGERTV